MNIVGIIIDVVIGIALLIAVIVGLKKGFINQLSGFIWWLATLVGSIVLTTLLMRLISGLSFYTNTFIGWTTSWFSGEAMTVEVYSVDELKTQLSAAGFWKFMTAFADKLFNFMGTIGASTVGQLLGNMFGRLIATFVVWLVVYIALKYLMKLILFLLAKLANVPVFSTLDRIFGLIWSVAMTYMVIVCVLLTMSEAIVLNFFSENLWNTFSGIIGKSYLLRNASNTNYIGNMILEMLPFLTVKAVPIIG